MIPGRMQRQGGWWWSGGEGAGCTRERERGTPIGTLFWRQARCPTPTRQKRHGAVAGPSADAGATVGLLGLMLFWDSGRALAHLA